MKRRVIGSKEHLGRVAYYLSLNLRYESRSKPMGFVNV